MTADTTTKRRALRLLRQGKITLSEAADLCDVSRQLVRHWCLREEIVPHEARANYLFELWARQR